jgi:hypothetical protein
MQGIVFDKYWTCVKAKVYVAALTMLLELMDEYPKKTIDELKEIIKEIIEREVEHHAVD